MIVKVTRPLYSVRTYMISSNCKLKLIHNYQVQYLHKFQDVITGPHFVQLIVDHSFHPNKILYYFLIVEHLHVLPCHETQVKANIYLKVLYNV